MVPNNKNLEITQHPDIDQYVLKSSVPPCPDLRNYALKSDMTSIDMSKYMLKSEVKACPPRPNLNDYVHKNLFLLVQIIPKCPVCPVLSSSGSNNSSEEEAFNRTITETSVLNGEDSSEQ